MFLNAPARLAKTLPQLADNRERRAKITQRDISQIIGLSREMTNEQLRGWERGNWVRLERGGVVLLQPKLLANFAEKPAMPFGHGFAPESPAKVRLVSAARVQYRPVLRLHASHQPNRQARIGEGENGGNNQESAR